MRIWTFDPGAVSTGLAVLGDDFSFWGQWSNPVDLYKAFERQEPSWSDVVLIEDYTHGGAFTKEAKQTLEIVGFLYYTASLDGFDVRRRSKDKRLSGQSEAARLMGDEVSVLKKDPERKDAFSALAHCVVFRREEM